MIFTQCGSWKAREELLTTFIIGTYGYHRRFLSRCAANGTMLQHSIEVGLDNFYARELVRTQSYH